MDDAALFATILVGFFVLRFIAATVIFMWILPTGDRCPNCDAVTLRVYSRVWSFLLPGFRMRWCYRCGWDGFMRPDPRESDPQSSHRINRPR